MELVDRLCKLVNRIAPCLGCHHSSLNAMTSLLTVDARRKAISESTPASRKSEFGQFLTPSVIARYMASLFGSFAQKDIRLLDAGAGIGSLTAAFVERVCREQSDSICCEAWEIDSSLHPALQTTLEACEDSLSKEGVLFSGIIRAEDFIMEGSSLFISPVSSRYTHAILNPPYKKINSDSAHRAALRTMGIETSNLYAAFVAKALKLLQPGGELVAITPRSFCNGTYFRPFRELLLKEASLKHIHIFESRTNAFKEDEVLQENVIFHLIKGQKQEDVVISSSADSTFSPIHRRSVTFAEVVLPHDREHVIHIALERESLVFYSTMRKYNNKLDDLDLAVSTGPVVDFRLRQYLRNDMNCDTSPLIYAHHFDKGFINHSLINPKKPNSIYICAETMKWLMPVGNYTLVRRLSSKEERHRVVPAVMDYSTVESKYVGIENHLNFFHSHRNGLPLAVARGLAVYLSSSHVDQWIRRFSGHTQVNASDLRALWYPDIATLQRWGDYIGDKMPSQEVIDTMVDGKL